MFIISLTYKRPIEDVEKYLDAHVEYLKNEYANGRFVVSGRKIPRTGGIILSNVASREALEASVERDPFYQANIAEFEIIEFEPSMVAEGFENLMTK